jgi:hypothetical protein
LTVALRLDTNGGDQVTGIVTDGEFSSDLLGDRQVFDGKTRRAAMAGKYTLILPGSTNALVSPAGDGFGSVTVDALGGVRFTGELADGTSVAQESFLSKDGVWPFYAPLYGGRGAILGWLTIKNQSDSDVFGKLTWIKPPLPQDKFYPDGFTTRISAVGSSYAEPAGAGELSQLMGVLRGGNLDELVINSLAAIGKTKASDEESQFKLTLAPATGFLSGSFLHPATQKVTPFKGAVLQKQNWRSGYFLGTNQSGFVFIGPPQ